MLRADFRLEIQAGLRFGVQNDLGIETYVLVLEWGSVLVLGYQRLETLFWEHRIRFISGYRSKGLRSIDTCPWVPAHRAAG